MNEARDKVTEAYEAMSLTDLLDLRLNGSYVFGVIDEIIVKKAEALESQVKELKAVASNPMIIKETV